ncbi:MAG: DUF3078 domain-containing protein [Muribaculaceae bacterium]|nr:DUF3078 domain-containing protein [Muribaculaceae bacterium]
MKRLLKTTIAAAAIAIGAIQASAQAMYFSHAKVDATASDAVQADTTVSVCDSLLNANAVSGYDIFDMPMTLPDVFFMPAVYDRYRYFTPLSVTDAPSDPSTGMEWIEDLNTLQRQMFMLQHDLFYNHPDLVKYNVNMLPEAPKPYVAEIDPSTFQVTLRESVTGPAAAPTIEAEQVARKHWIKKFNASLQFSQAYVSPNWYQGGNNNLNALGQLYYNVRLNETFHPNLLFETTAQYKLGMNNAPNDTVHSYNISDDVFQVNTTFGIKAVKNWYYSFTGQFKTQLLNSYKSNSQDLKSAFLSPGELTAGVGMTYSYKNKPKTFVFDASIAPVSYNLTTCISRHINPATYNIEEGHKSVSKFGSTAELKLNWKISYNISFSSRVFAFTDYESFQADWENTLAFEINRFLTTQIYAHLRYDTKTPHVPDTNWKKLQIKEIFSIGFAYKFSTM